MTVHSPQPTFDGMKGLQGQGFGIHEYEKYEKKYEKVVWLNLTKPVSKLGRNV